MRIAVPLACLSPFVFAFACAPTTTFVETSDYQAAPKESGKRLSMEKGRKSDEAAIRLVYSMDVDATDAPIEDDAL